MTNIQASFKKDQTQYDGLSAVNDDLVKAPLTPVVIVATAEVTRITHTTADGMDNATVRLRHIEVAGGADAVTVTGILAKLYGERTGRDDPAQPSLFDPDVTGEDQGQADGDGPWPGDVEFSDSVNVEGDATSTTPERKRRPRKPDADS